MRRRTKVLVGMGAAVVVLGGAAVVGPAVYVHVVNANADPVPTISLTGVPVAGGDPAPAADGTWTVGSGSFAGYRVHEVLQGHDATVTGRTTDVSGTVTVAGGRATAGTVTVQVADIHTDEPPRDVYFRSSALETDRFPTATFELTSPVALRTGSATLAGRLTVHGVERAVSTTAQVAVSGGRAQVVVSIPVTWSDFGVQAPHLGFVTVDGSGDVEVSLDLVAP